MAPPGIKMNPINVDVCNDSLPSLAPIQAPKNLPKIATVQKTAVGHNSNPIKKSIWRPSVAKKRGTKMAFKVSERSFSKNSL